MSLILRTIGKILGYALGREDWFEMTKFLDESFWIGTFKLTFQQDIDAYKQIVSSSLADR